MKTEYVNELSGERLQLRRNTSNQKLAEVMFATVDINREHLRKWFDWTDGTKSVQDSVNYLESVDKEFKEGTKVDYGVYVENNYLGNIGLFDIDTKHKSAEIGYWLAKEATGKGYMTEAMATLEKYFFEEIGLNRIELFCDVDNDSSRRVAEKSGYQLEGRMREYKYNPTMKEMRDMFAFAKLKSDYEKHNTLR